MSEICLGNCEGCPRIRRLVSEHDDISDLMGRMGKQALSEDIEKMAPIMFERLKTAGVFDIPGMSFFDLKQPVEINSPEDLIRASRASTANVLEIMDKQREEKQREAEDWAAGCNGALKMRATKDGVTVTVTACMSPQAAESGEETVIILRERPEEQI